MCFSGVETKVKGLVQTEEPSIIASAVIENVSKALTKAINSAIQATGLNRVLVVGGVASNSIIRERFSQSINGKVMFGSSELSSDNAVGTAALAKISYKEVCGNGTENSNSVTD